MATPNNRSVTGLMHMNLFSRKKHANSLGTLAPLGLHSVTASLLSVAEFGKN